MRARIRTILTVIAALAMAGALSGCILVDRGGYGGNRGHGGHGGHWRHGR